MNEIEGNKRKPKKCETHLDDHLNLNVYVHVTIGFVLLKVFWPSGLRRQLKVQI